MCWSSSAVSWGNGKYTKSNQVNWWQAFLPESWHDVVCQCQQNYIFWSLWPNGWDCLCCKIKGEVTNIHSCEQTCTEKPNQWTKMLLAATDHYLAHSQSLLLFTVGCQSARMTTFLCLHAKAAVSLLVSAYWGSFRNTSGQHTPNGSYTYTYSEVLLALP